ncbi:alpha/beta fold hydrolase [Actinosynnema sp. NPDC020468]|uniref:thioesterase II family protein n=1 Tax=Actinosynnema sp. NPDC020468 TaxID=3154488 RepID=UPI0033FF8CA4
MGTTGSVWLHRPKHRPGARLRLVCLPYAGGDTVVWWPWADGLGEDVELWCVRLPGRGRRFGEPALTDVADVVGPLAEAVRDLGPVVLFGHSMGAVIAFELARRLDEVAHVVLSAAAAPRLMPRGDAHLLDDNGLIAWMTELGGAPPALLADPELLSLVLPTLRADLALCAGYRDVGPPLDVPLTVVVGDRDPLVPVAHARAWRDRTTAAFACRVHPGGHFSVQDDPSQVFAAVRDCVKEGAR